MKIGIIGAMDVEVNLLKESAQISRRVTRADMEFCEGKLGSTDVVIAKCGMGKVNSGICAQILIDLFGVTHIVNTGVAGGLNKSLNVGDVVVAVDAVQHDFDVTILGFQKGEVPYTGKYAFECDAFLRERALKAAREVAHDRKVIEGRTCAGDIFIQTKEQADAIISAFNPDSIEMESGAIGQVCYLNHIPFAVIRVISDTTKEDVEASSYKDVEAMTAKLCASIIRNMIERL